MEKFPKMAPLDICKVLRAISDDKALALFNIIALAESNDVIPIGKLKLTRKQYYSRISAMINAGLLARRNGRYFLTTYGKVVYEAHALIGKAQQDYWKLKAVDAIETSNSGLVPEERNKFINGLIVDKDLKRILLRCNGSNDNNQEIIALQESFTPAKYPLQNIDPQ
jgi:hypothetical protein